MGKKKKLQRKCEVLSYRVEALELQKRIQELKAQKKTPFGFYKEK